MLLVCGLSLCGLQMSAGLTVGAWPAVAPVRSTAQGRRILNGDAPGFVVQPSAGVPSAVGHMLVGWLC